MSLCKKIEKYCKNNSENNQIPDYFYCSETVSYDTGEITGIELEPHWDFEQNESKRISIPQDDSLYSEVKNKFSNLRSKVELSKGEIPRVTLNKNYFEKSEFISDYDFYGVDDYTFSSLLTVNVTQPISEQVSGKFISLIQDELKKIDKDISKEQIVSFEVSFDDMKECKLLSIRGNVVTKHPYRYYSNVDSVEEYIDKVSNTPEEYDELKNKETYHVMYRLDDPDDIDNEDIPNAVPISESIMQEQMQSIASVTGEFMFEAESIVMKNYQSYPEHNNPDKMFTTYRIDDNSEKIFFFIHIPFNNL